MRLPDERPALGGAGERPESGRKVASGPRTTDDLLLDEAPGGDGDPRLGPGRQGTEPLLGDDGILVGAEHVLEILRRPDERLPRTVIRKRRELRGVARPLAGDPQAVHGRIVG